jgi:hypothetical protein
LSWSGEDLRRPLGGWVFGWLADRHGRREIEARNDAKNGREGLLLPRHSDLSEEVATEYDLQKLLPDLLVAGLENDDVDRGFDVPGEENLDVVASLRDSSTKLVFARVWDRPIVAGFQRSAGMQASRIERAG